MKDESAILYFDDSSSSVEARKLLKGARIAVTERVAPSSYRAAYRIPVLFGLFTKFEGLDGIRVFVANSTLLNRPTMRTKRHRS